MRTLIVIALTAIVITVAPTRAEAIPFPLDVSSAIVRVNGEIETAVIGRTLSGFVEIDFDVSALVGTVYTGQTLSLDFVFADNLLARLYHAPDFVFQLRADGRADGVCTGDCPATPEPSTGYLLGRDGQPLSAPVEIGHLQSGVDVVLGLRPPRLRGLTDVSGAHADIVLPSSGEVATDASMRWVFLPLNFPWILDSPTVRFDTAAHCPNPHPCSCWALGWRD